MRLAEGNALSHKVFGQRRRIQKALIQPVGNMLRVKAPYG